MILFSKGIPLSRWSYAKRNQTISDSAYRKAYIKFLDSIDLLFKDEKIILINESSPIGEDSYLDIFSSLLFLINDLNLQDAMLITTAILQKSDFFITDDQPLRKSAKNIISKEYGLEIVNQTEALIDLKKRC